MLNEIPDNTDLIKKSLSHFSKVSFEKPAKPNNMNEKASISAISSETSSLKDIKHEKRSKISLER